MEFISGIKYFSKTWGNADDKFVYFSLSYKIPGRHPDVGMFMYNKSVRQYLSFRVFGIFLVLFGELFTKMKYFLGEISK